ncbi:phosphoribosyl-AMP cyclohydrolase [Arthrobacter sp. PL16]|uniref:phosphoribosyl-AMP cyclohydrolase n=1 Tax=Arthrobacter sp. PL16 TaxID=3071720 RepID=UPI002E0B4A65|nr:phosphoribosyl-AMP cyclohydrolase [Arthrobacter sp. PL16]
MPSTTSSPHTAAAPAADSPASAAADSPLAAAGEGRAAPHAALDPDIAAALKKDDAGLVAAVVQQYDTLEVLMLGWMDEEALRRTLSTGRVTFYSRSRSEYWRKGDTSGHRQWVRAVALDCDGDALLVTVDQEGPACHTGTRTCFDGRALPAVTAGRSDAEGL